MLTVRLEKLQWINTGFGFDHGIGGWTRESPEEVAISETCRKARTENIRVFFPRDFLGTSVSMTNNLTEKYTFWHEFHIIVVEPFKV